MARGTIYDQGLSVLGDYRRYVEQNLPGAIAKGSAALLETVAENMTVSVLETALLGKAKWLSGILTFTSRHFSGTVVKNDAVRNMTMYTQIQSLFQDCYSTTAAGGIDADAALLMKSAALMYLKSAWHSVGAFSFDTGSESLVDILPGQSGTPTGRLSGPDPGRDAGACRISGGKCSPLWRTKPCFPQTPLDIPTQLICWISPLTTEAVPRRISTLTGLTTPSNSFSVTV